MVLGQKAHDRIERYIDDLIALEDSGITGLEEMISAAKHPEDATMLQEHLDQTRRQKDRLEGRLHELGGSNNKVKNVMNKIGVAASGLLHATHDKSDKATRHLLELYSIESLEVATYESLYAASSEVGDTATATLAKEIQAEEEAMAKRVYARVEPLAREAMRDESGG